MRWNSRLSMRLQTIMVNLITAGVIASVAAAAWGLLLRLVDAFGAPSPPPVIRVPPPARPAVPFRPFGIEDRSNLPEATSLPIELRGTIYSSSERLVVAFVSREGGPPHAVRIGEDAGGGTILQIERDHLLLRVGDRTERLSFPNTTESAGGKRSGPPAANPPAAGGAKARGQMPGLPPHMSRGLK